MLLPPPELHILLGLGNDFFKSLVDRLQKHLGLIETFMKRYNLKLKKYFTNGRTEFRGQFAGNECKSMLDHVDDLADILKQNREAFRIAESILVAMKAFNNVRIQCFGKVLNPNSNLPDNKRLIREFAFLWL